MCVCVCVWGGEGGTRARCAPRCGEGEERELEERCERGEASGVNVIHRVKITRRGDAAVRRGGQSPESMGSAARGEAPRVRKHDGACSRSPINGEKRVCSSVACRSHEGIDRRCINVCVRVSGARTRCQRCLSSGHWTYEVLETTALGVILCDWRYKACFLFF